MTSAPDLPQFWIVKNKKSDELLKTKNLNLNIHPTLESMRQGEDSREQYVDHPNSSLQKWCWGAFELRSHVLQLAVCCARHVSSGYRKLTRRPPSNRPVYSYEHELNGLHAGNHLRHGSSCRCALMDFMSYVTSRTITRIEKDFKFYWEQKNSESKRVET